MNLTQTSESVEAPPTARTATDYTIDDDHLYHLAGRRWFKPIRAHVITFSNGDRPWIKVFGHEVYVLTPFIGPLVRLDDHPREVEDAIIKALHADRP
jgi:hypothetical protein